MQTKSPAVNQTKFDDSEFRKSSLCTFRDGECVGVAMRPGVIAVRHTRDPQKTTLEFTPGEWDAFIQGVKKGEFELLLEGKR